MAVRREATAIRGKLMIPNQEMWYFLIRKRDISKIGLAAYLAEEIFAIALSANEQVIPSDL